MDKPVSAPALSAAAASGAESDRPATAAEAAASMYVEHGALLRRIAIRKFGIPPAEAEGLVHDVFINFLAIPRNVTSDLRAYLIASICNASRNYRRARMSEARHFPGLEEASVANVTADERIFDNLARNLAVAQTLARLGSRCREALKRYYLRGEDTPTVAAAMGTTPANVNYLMHVCRKKARAIYEQLTRTR